MYKRNSKILAALLTIVLVFSIFPSLRVNAAASGTCGAQGDNLTWTLDDAGVLTISGTGAMADYDVLTGRAPWYNQSDLIKKVVIEGNVTSIGSWAFFECANIDSVQFCANVTSIGEFAFRKCSSLTSITLPETVQSIGNGAFGDCSGLVSINIPDGISVIDNNTFYECSSLTSITIPDSVTTINLYAFKGCSSLTSITIPNSVKTIVTYAFDGCSSLTSITIPDSVTTIENYAFKDCSSLTSITILSNVTPVEMYSFFNCPNLTNVNLKKSVYDSLGNKDFYGCSASLEFNIIYDITYTDDGNGKITGEAYFEEAKTIDLTVTPNNNYVVDKITVTDSTGTSTEINKDSSGNYSFTMPSDDVTVEAFFKLAPKIITFVNEDGTVLQSGLVDCGTNPAYTGATPAKAEDDQYTYTFAGWSDGTKTYGPTDTLPAVTDDTTYTAVFDSTVRKFTIKFINEDGTILKSGDFDYGTTPAYTGSTPTKAEDDDYTYTFAGWTPAIASVTGNATYTATFAETAKPTSEPTTPAPVTVSKPGTYYLSSMVEQDGNIVITIKMSEDDTKTFDLLGTVTSDGVPLTEGNQYTSAKGSAIITINKSFLDTLAAGNHKLTVTFTDGGSITIDYEVKAPAAAPQAAAQAVQATGEAISAASIAGACLILAAAGIAFTVTRKRKEEA